MKCFFAPETDLHDPQFRLTLGTVQRNAERVERSHKLQAGLEALGFKTEVPPEAPGSDLELVHSARFLNFLENAWPLWQSLPGAGREVVPNVFPRLTDARYPNSIIGRAGWHMGDTSAPIGEHSWRAAQRAADCALAAADAVLGDDIAAYALCRPAGHHASAEVAAGHCLLNNAALAASRLRKTHDRVAILDIDVHHGNGTQEIFYGRDDVLTVSIHAHPDEYYPFFTGRSDEAGTGDGEGFNLNIPLARSTSDAGWLEALDQAISRVNAFAPGALVLSLGLDAHENDPLEGMKVTWDGFRRAGARIAQAGYPTAMIQEGGYLSEDLTQSLIAFLEGFCQGRDAS